MEPDALPARRESAIHVLVVDDTLDARLSLSSLLRLVGYVVYEAADAAQALVLLQSSMPVDVLLTDVDMPGAMDGLALAAFVRATRPDIVVAVISGGDHAATIRDPDVLFLQKPYDFERLLAHLRRAPRA